MATLRQLVHKVIFKTEGRTELVKANRAMGDSASNSRSAARQTNKLAVSLRGVFSAARRAASSVGGFARRLGSFAARNLKFAAAGVIGLGIATLKLAGDAEETRGKMEVALGDLTNATERWVKRTSDALGTNRNKTRQFVTDFSLQLQTATDKARATDLAKELTSRAFDIESFFNVPIDEVFSSLRSGLNGSSEPLEKFNVNIKEGALTSFILSEGLARSKAEITDSTKKLARLQIILRKTSEAQGDLERTGGSFTNQLRRARAQIVNTATDFGTKLLPIATRALVKINELLLKNRDAIVEFAGKIAGFIEDFVDGGGLERLNDGFKETVRLLGQAAKLAGRVIDAVTISDEERAITEEINRQGGGIANIFGRELFLTNTGAVNAAVRARQSLGLAPTQAQNEFLAQRTAPGGIPSPAAAFGAVSRAIDRANVNIDAPVTVNVTEGNAERAGRNFGRGVVDGARNASSRSDSQTAYAG